MANSKKGVLLTSLLVLVAITISSCERPYSEVPLDAATADGTSVFVSPFPTSDNPMAMVEEYATGTAVAETAAALTAGTPLAVSTTPAGTEITPVTSPTATLATQEIMCTPPACAAGESLVCPSGSTCPGGCGYVCAPNTPTATPPSSTSGGSTTSSCGASYTLQSGEFPFCIARRCDVDPAELLALNGLASGDIYYPNLTLKIPQSGKPFPGDRSLNNHPATFIVGSTSSADSIYGVACYYGDIEPSSIANANNLSLNAQLSPGQSLTIP